MIEWLFERFGVSAGVFDALLIAWTFCATIACLKIFRKLLPHDGGRDFAFNGKLSKGKLRGAGIIFISVFALTALLFIRFNLEYLAYYVLVFLSMLSGYLDDRAKKPWGEYKKGLIDLILCLATAAAFVWFNPELCSVGIAAWELEIPRWLFALILTVFFWLMINATNCSDGIDGYCGSLSIVVLLSLCLVGRIVEMESGFQHLMLIMLLVIGAYLWYNCEPSTILMGDAGSRAIGLFLGIAVAKTGNVLLCIPLCFVILLDGLLGIVKVSLIRFLKIKAFQNIRTPLHDHFRMKKNWSNTQVIFRSILIQCVISAVVIALLRI